MAGSRLRAGVALQRNKEKMTGSPRDVEIGMTFHANILLHTKLIHESIASLLQEITIIDSGGVDSGWE